MIRFNLRGRSVRCCCWFLIQRLRSNVAEAKHPLKTSNLLLLFCPFRAVFARPKSTFPPTALAQAEPVPVQHGERHQRARMWRRSPDPVRQRKETLPVLRTEGSSTLLPRSLSTSISVIFGDAPGSLMLSANSSPPSCLVCGPRPSLQSTPESILDILGHFKAPK